MDERASTGLIDIDDPVFTWVDDAWERLPAPDVTPAPYAGTNISAETGCHQCCCKKSKV